MRLRSSLKLPNGVFQQNRSITAGQSEPANGTPRHGDRHVEPLQDPDGPGPSGDQINSGVIFVPSRLTLAIRPPLVST
jgi:hypothetical protein